MDASQTASNSRLHAIAETIVLEHNHNRKSLVSLKDFLNISLFMMIKKALSLFYIDISPATFSFFNSPSPAFRVGGSIYISRTWLDRGLYWAPASPGYWIDQRADGGVLASGEDPISLLAYLSSEQFLAKCTNERRFVGDQQLQEAAARFLPDSSEPQVIVDAIERLGIDIDRPSLKQHPARHGWAQSPWAYPSTRRFGDRTELVDPWPKASPDRLPFLGSPSATFDIRDQFGHPQAIIGSWSSTWGIPLWASFVPCHRDTDPSEQRWLFQRSSTKLPPFDLGTVLEFPEATVVIDDDLFVVRSVNQKLRDKFGEPPIVMAGWVRAIEGATPEDTDWRVMRGRNVICAVNDDRESFSYELTLGAELVAVGAEDVKVALPLKLADGRKELRICWDTGALIGDEVTFERFAEIAHERFGITTQRVGQVSRPLAWQLGDPAPSNSATTIYLLDPILPEGTATVLYSKPGVGKSWKASLMGYAAAGAMSILGGRLKAITTHKALYICTENVRAQIARIESIHRSLGCADAMNNFKVYPNPDRSPGKINLELPETWDAIGGLVVEADLIIIDHLTNVTTGLNDPATWRRFWGHIERLKRQNKTLLILHHSGKDGKQTRGTSLLDADVDAIIRMEELPDIENGALITFEKHRDDESLGKNLAPVTMLWDKDDATGRVKWWVQEPEEKSAKVWVECPNDDHQPNPQLDDSYILAHFTGRKTQIVTSLGRHHLRDGQGLPVSVIAAELDVSESTILSELGGLIDQGNVIRIGQGRATKYCLSDETVKAVIKK